MKTRGNNNATMWGKQDTRKEINEINLTNEERIAAIVWKAKKLGLSYGRFAVGLTEEVKSEAYREYATYLSEYRKEQRRITAAYMKEKKKRNEPC